MDLNIQTDTSYTDFRKAFDKINHYILIRKLSDGRGTNGDLPI